MDSTQDAAMETDPRLLIVYTQTLIESPVIRWILPARMRNGHQDDVIFIGDRTIHIKQLSHGYLSPVATNNDLDARILAASTLRTDLDPKVAEDGLTIKPDLEHEFEHNPNRPLDTLVLVLDNARLSFFHLVPHTDDTYVFVHRRDFPLPSFSNAIHRLGAHLSIDHAARAIAVAAMDREVWVGLVQHRSPPRRDSRAELEGNLIHSARSFRIDGTIQHMTFLTPRAGDEDHVVLLLITIDAGRTKAVCIDWYHSVGFGHVQPSPAHTLDSHPSTLSLLIPLKDTSFLLSKGQEIVQWKNLLSGSPTAYAIHTADMTPKHPGISPRAPVWASWSRPRRSLASSHQKDDVYLAREDGLVILLSPGSGASVETSFAGDLECHVGTAFAALGDESDPDILAVAGDMSPGRIVTIGALPESGSLNREEAMSMNLTQWIPNWASALDMIPSDLGTACSTPSQHSHGFYVTAGRQPFGSIVELRRGLELQMATYFELDELKSVIDIWALPDISTGSALVLLSRPTSTQLLRASGDLTDIAEVDALHPLDMSQRTLAAGMLTNEHLVQVTPHSINVTPFLHGTPGSTLQLSPGEGTEILTACINSAFEAVLYVYRNSQQEYLLRCEHITCATSTTVAHSRSRDTVIPSQPLCMAVAKLDGRDSTALLIALGFADSSIGVICYDDDIDITHSRFEQLARTAHHEVGICEQVAILPHPRRRDTRRVVACGLRDGHIVTYSVGLEDHSLTFGRIGNGLKLSNTAAKFVRYGPDSLIAITGTDFCLLKWRGKSGQLCLVAENIWISDKSRPDISQGSVAAACPIELHTDSAPSSTPGHPLILVFHDEIVVGFLGETPAVVPRQISLRGTPNRIIYSEELRCFVCSSEISDTRALASSNNPLVVSRQRRPVIEFVPAKKNAPSFQHALHPGDTVRALLSWSYRSDQDKTYFYIIIGGGRYTNHSSARKGRLCMIQPQLRHREVIGLSSRPHVINPDAEVFALAIYDDVTFIASSGENILVFRFSPEAKRWHQICPPFRLASPGIYITTQEGTDGQKLITISTARDSIIVLILRPAPTPRTDDGDLAFVLIPHAVAPRAEVTLSHLAVSTEDMPRSDERHKLTLVSTKDCRLLGLRYSDHIPAVSSRPAAMVFQATLRGALRRVWRCEPLPRKGAPPVGVLSRFVGSRTDGAIVGIALLDRDSRGERLLFLQRLLSLISDPWDEEASVRLDRDTLESTGPRESHIDGDVIRRLMKPGELAQTKARIRDLFQNERDTWLSRTGSLEEFVRDLDDLVVWIRQLHSWM